MKACIATYFMPNVNPKVVECQANVIKKFNKSNVQYIPTQGKIPHGLFIDYFWCTNGVPVSTLASQNIKQELDFDLVLFLDIDCVPVHEDAIDYYIESASKGNLVGNAQRSNHIDNGQHVFAAPSAFALSRETFVKIGSPSAMETQRSDVGEEYTWNAEKVGVPLDIILPLRHDAPPIRMAWEPKDSPPHWALADGMPVYGIGTTFGKDKDMFWHNFQIFQPGQHERFYRKCEELLA